MAFTYFFRDLQTLQMICDHAIPTLRSRRYINVWDAGCAMGPEPYTLAMLLREGIGHMYFRNIKIKATDIDGSNLFDKIILEGIYPKEQVERIPKDVFGKYFVNDNKEGHFRLTDEIRKSVTYQKHDLLTLKSIGKDFGLILCKNVLLHFNEVQRIEVLRMFHESLIDGGYLAMEQTQKLPKELEALFEPVVSNAQLYRKISS
ncbi:CheR family methyltransferase [Acetobacterium bakii]|uniref:Chemotaxis protein CheR n=1 Tax=Acetobacterium bakii TaxID=52689 RepID=A0A0L6U4A3_9FIRM|nr:CheR family methyltransferase [Acetobacterium bakii]KNZ42645.1 chemotaxis protein CheR [Acetobacterium bakii]